MTAARSYQVALEAAGDLGPRARSSQLAAEVVSRSGLGHDPLVGNPAVVQTLTAEAVGTPGARAVAAQLVLEVVSRSGLGVTPLTTGNPALLSEFAAEISATPAPAAALAQLALEAVSRSGLGREPLRGNPAVVQGIALEVLSFGVADDPCDCTISPALPPPRYLMRRPRR